MNMNPLSLLSMLKNSNPQNMVMNMIFNMFGNKNPMINNLISYAKNGDNNSLMNFARNVCKEKGLDFEKEWSNFLNNFNNR